MVVAPAPRDVPVVAAPALPDTDLLADPRAVVTVSSSVDNTHELPEHLIDGDPTTAWSSRTDDLTTAWVRLRVPDGSRVHALRLIVGYAKTQRGEDLFVMNHRVRSVRVRHGQEVVGTFPLDPERRDAQTIPLSGAGGVWQVDFVELVPGTRRAWREVCVSEIALLGASDGAAPDAGARVPSVVVDGYPRAATLTEDSARAMLATARGAMRVALAGENPEPGTTWYPHDNMMRYYGARADLAAAQIDLATSRCPVTAAFSQRVLVYRAAARIERDYAERYGREWEPEANMGDPNAPRPSTTQEGFARRRAARDAAYEAVRAACPGGSGAAALDVEAESVGDDL